MAIMHPSSIARRKHVPSEEKFFNACRDQLSDKYHVFFSVRWYSEENGKRIDSECDFLIFNPDYGFLCIECKGGKNIYVDDGTWYLEDYNEDRKLRRSPYLQAEESMRFFKRYYEEELETIYPGIYGNAVAFPNFAIKSPITIESPLALTIDIDGMSNLQKRIVEIFNYFNVKRSGRASFMSPDSQKKFISLINKRVSLSIAAGALIGDKERELAEINQTQDVVIDLLVHYQRAFIVGGAGTGKTWIGIKKIKRCLLSGKKPLYICFNPTLANYVSKQIGESKADIYSIDELALKELGEAAVNTAPTTSGCKEYSSLFEEKKGLSKYDLIIVDEAQDFTEDWAYCMNLLLKEQGSLYVFYDESQNVFSRDFGEKFFIDETPFVLRYNIRNTSNIYRYTQDRSTLGLDTLVNQIEGVEPDVRKLTRKQAVISFVDSVVNKLINKEGVAPESIVVISNREKADSVLGDVSFVGGYPIKPIKSSSGGVVRFSTVEEFKGLEADIVIYINHTYKNEANTDNIKSVHYTAMTRARFFLYVIDYEVN